MDEKFYSLTSSFGTVSGRWQSDKPNVSNPPTNRADGFQILRDNFDELFVYPREYPPYAPLWNSYQYNSNVKNPWYEDHVWFTYKVDGCKIEFLSPLPSDCEEFRDGKTAGERWYPNGVI